MKRFLAALLFTAAMLVSCASIRPEPPEVSLLSLAIEEVTLSHVNMTANLNFFNPNRFSVRIREVNYRLLLNGQQVSDGKSLQPLDIAASSHGEIPLRISGAYWNIFRLLNSLQQTTDLEFSLDGEVKVIGYGLIPATFTFSNKGSLPLNQLSP